MIHYFCEDYDVPSWGVGLLYHHVRLLRELGFDACMLHQRAPFRVSWLDVDVPVRHLEEPGLSLRASDVVVVPEVLAKDPRCLTLPCRRFVFVQSSFLIVAGTGSTVDYRELGYEAAFTTMPHMHAIVARHHGLTPGIIPPFIAEYFFVEPEDLAAPRPRRLLLAAKPEYRQVGYLDYDIVSAILPRFLSRLASRSGGPGWELLELHGRSHQATAALMKESALLVNLNALESFNAVVPEAMAAGCAVLCYDAFGGIDFLRDGENAYVFPNNHAYPLLGALCDLLEAFDSRRTELDAVRTAGLATASRYREEHTARALVEFYRPLRP